MIKRTREMHIIEVDHDTNPAALRQIVNGTLEGLEKTTGREMHFLQAVSLEGRGMVWLIFREMEPAKGGRG